VPNIQQRPDAPTEHANEATHRRLIAQRANAGLPTDGSKAMEYPLLLKSYVVAGLPSAALWEGGQVYVSNEAGGKVVAFSDGTNWRRCTDRAVVS
jgi:hypothetical protein